MINFAIKVYKVIFFSILDGLRRILTILCTKTLNGRPTSILEQVVTVDVQLWKGI